MARYDLDGQQTIAGCWAEFEKTLHPKAPPVQRREMRKAFYAGAGVMLMMIKQLSEREDLSEDDVVRLYQRFGDELEAFMHKVLRGEA